MRKTTRRCAEASGSDPARAGRPLANGHCRDRADPCTDRPHHGHLRLHAPVPCSRAAHRNRTARSQDDRAQLRARWQRLVAVVGLERARSAPGARDRSARDRRDRLRCARADIGDSRAARGPFRAHLREGIAAGRVLDARVGFVDARFAHLRRRTRGRVRRSLGRDDAHVVPHVSEPARPARQADRVDRRLCGFGCAVRCARDRRAGRAGVRRPAFARARPDAARGRSCCSERIRFRRRTRGATRR